MSGLNGLHDMFGADRYFCVGMQVYDWGTLCQHHRFTFPRVGHLITGPSGAGKSSLLDAHSALITPPAHINFNAASRDGNKKTRDRSFVTYVRGTWGQQTDEASGRAVHQHLRSGSTWSAIAETYETESGRAVTLAQIYWIKGAGCQAEDVQSYYLVADRALDLKELDVFAKSGFNIKATKAALPDVFFARDFKAYKERFCSRLGIERDLALTLLHKAQAAKNLENIDDFLRHYMLDKPQSAFDAAEALVGEFENLESARRQVVEARDQVALLRPARDAVIEKKTALVQVASVRDLEQGNSEYVFQLEERLTSDRIGQLDREISLAKEQEDAAKAAQGPLHTELIDLQMRHRGIGGGDIAAKKDELRRLEEEQASVERRRRKVADAFDALDWEFPGSGTIFAMQKQNAVEALEAISNRRTNGESERGQLAEQEIDARRAVEKLVTEIRAMEGQSSSIPGDDLEMRARIAKGVNVPEEMLPFAGELMQVKKSEEIWTGAIERVLRRFALTILVDGEDQRLYEDVTAFVNANNMRGHVVYLRTTKNEVHGLRTSPTNHLVHKIDFKPGRWDQWLKNELMVSFAYQCVGSVAELRKVERGVTREGQVKHNSRRHEKNDRYKVDDRGNWVMGFDNAEKQAHFHARLLEQNKLHGEIKRKLAAIDDARSAEQAKVVPYAAVSDADWAEIDPSPLVQSAKLLRGVIRDLEEGNAELKTLEAQIAELGQRLSQVQKEQFAHESTAKRLELERVTLAETLARLQRRVLSVLTPAQLEGLERTYQAVDGALTLASLPEMVLRVEKSLQAQRFQHDKTVASCDHRISSAFQQFVATFRNQAGNLGSGVEFADDYMAMLERLENDNLPSFLDNFVNLLNNQTWQHLIALNSHIVQARKEISERLDIVNDALQSVDFNVGTRIQIIANDKNRPEVREFRTELKEVLSNFTAESAESADARYAAISKLVKRFAGKNDIDQRWRDLVLDVREHVEFVGSERREDGTEAESYGTDGGKSGGQKQKLAITCLAAALRYQLGGSDERPPTFSTIVLDEAFMRTDNVFTRQCMEIFQVFKFQMIIATPLKSVMAIEPYVGGATFVNIRERKFTEAMEISYDAVNKRFAVSEEMQQAMAAEEALEE